MPAHLASRFELNTLLPHMNTLRSEYRRQSQALTPLSDADAQSRVPTSSQKRDAVKKEQALAAIRGDALLQPLLRRLFAPFCPFCAF